MQSNGDNHIEQSKAFDGAYLFISSYFPEINDSNRIRMLLSAMKKNERGLPADKNTEYTLIESLAKVHNAPIEKYLEFNSKGLLKASLADWFKALEKFLNYFDSNGELQPILKDVMNTNVYESDDDYLATEVWKKWEKCCLAKP